MADIIELAVSSVPQFTRRRVLCHQCGFTMTVDSALCIISGWPICHGETMTFESGTGDAYSCLKNFSAWMKREIAE